MGDPKDKSWLEKAEDYVSDDYDRQRALIPEYDYEGKVLHDVKVGAMKGVYHGVKGLVSGVIDLLILGYKVQYDPETSRKANEFIISAAKEIYISKFGSPEEIRDQNQRIMNWGSKVWDSVKKSVTEQWEEAGKTPGKRTELVSQWVSRGVFEVALFFVGAGEAKAAVEGASGASKLAETGRILDAADVGCQTVVMSREEILAEQAAKDAAEAAERAKVARQEAVTKEMKAAEPPPEGGEVTKVEKAPQKEPDLEDWDDKTPKDGVPAVPPRKVPPGIPKDALKEGDLVFGTYPNKEPRMTDLVDGTGAKLVTDLPNPIPGNDRLSSGVRELSTDALDYAAREGKQVHFDLNGLDTEAALTGKGPHANSVTSTELRHVRDNWSTFDPKPKFYENGAEVPPPWLK